MQRISNKFPLPPLLNSTGACYQGPITKPHYPIRLFAGRGPHVTPGRSEYIIQEARSTGLAMRLQPSIPTVGQTTCKEAQQVLTVGPISSQEAQQSPSVGPTEIQSGIHQIFNRRPTDLRANGRYKKLMGTALGHSEIQKPSSEPLKRTTETPVGQRDPQDTHSKKRPFFEWPKKPRKGASQKKAFFLGGPKNRARAPRKGASQKTGP